MKLKKLKKRNISNIILIIVFSIVFLITSVLFKVFGITDIWSQLTGTLLGTIITAIVTVSLLTVQTDKEISHDRDVGVFEKKQDVYHNFITALEKITQDGKLNIPSQKDEIKNEPVIDELQDLIYQLGLIQMHAKSDTAKKITEQVGELIGTLPLLNNITGITVYPQLADNVFKIVNYLREDLYGEPTDPVTKKDFYSTLAAAGLFDTKLCSAEESQIIMIEYFSKLLSILSVKRKISISNANLSGNQNITDSCIRQFFNHRATKSESSYGYLIINIDLNEPHLENDGFVFTITSTIYDNGGYWYGFRQVNNKKNLSAKYKEYLPNGFEYKGDQWIGIKNPNPLGWTEFFPDANTKNAPYLRYARASQENRSLQIKFLADSILEDISRFEMNVLNGLNETK
jgi:hypothetical protein